MQAEEKKRLKKEQTKLSGVVVTERDGLRNRKLGQG